MITLSKPSYRAVTMTIATVVIAFGFAACNTISGAGKDIKSGGKAIEKSAEASK